MRFVATFMVTAVILSTGFRASAEGYEFLSSLPDKMECKASEFSALLNKRTTLAEKVKIIIEGKNTNTRLVEVFAPSATDEDARHFKIGRGYHANLIASESYDYLFIPDKKMFAYLEVFPSGNQELTFEDYITQRDAGSLVYFSTKSIMIGLYRSIQLITCEPVN